MSDPANLWVYLSTSPLFWLSLTVISYAGALRFAWMLNSHPAANPILLASSLIIIVLLTTRTSYSTYFEGAQFVNFLMGPATVAIAVPIYRHRAVLRQVLVPMAGALFVGAIVAMTSALGIGTLCGLPSELLIDLAPKSVTAAVAMALTKQMGGTPSITMLLVMFTGIFGAVVVTPLMNFLGIRNYAARGFAVGLASHGVGTARAFSVSTVAGLFAAIAMGLNAVVTALILPWIVTLFLK